MADQLDLAIVLKAVLDAKGFEEAQGKIKALAAQANATKPALDKTADAGKRMGQELGGTRGPVADLTRLMLANVGATSQAGEAAKFMGEATLATAGGVSALSLAAGGLVVVLSFVVPRMIDWLKNTKDQNKEQQDLLAKLEQVVPLIEKYAAAAKQITDAAAIQLLAERGKKLKEEKDELTKITAEIERLEPLLRQAFEAGMKGQALTKAYGEQAARLTELKARAEDLRKAQSENITTTTMYQGKIDDLTGATNALSDAMEYQLEVEGRQAQERLDAIGAAQDFAEGQEKDADRHMKEDQKKQDAETKRKLKTETEYQLDYAQMKRDEQRLDAQTAEFKKQNSLEAIGYTGQALTALSTFFGNNKALAVAGAIADTYAGAALALRTIPPPAGYAAAAFTITQGLAAVANIRNATPEMGFDDPDNDDVIRQFGMKWANDMASLLNQGFYSQVGALAGGGNLAGGGASTTVYDQRTIHQGGTTHNYGGIHGLMASSPTQFARGLDRAMTRAQRFRSRTTIGARRRPQ